MAVDDGNGTVIIDADVVRLDPNDLAVLLVSLIDNKIPLASSGGQEEPDIRKAGRQRPRDGDEGAVRDEEWVKVGR